MEVGLPTTHTLIFGVFLSNKDKGSLTSDLWFSEVERPCLMRNPPPTTTTGGQQ